MKNKKLLFAGIIVTVIFLILFIWLIVTSESQRNDTLNGGSFIGPVIYFLFTPGALLDLFFAPSSCRDSVSSFQSYLSCPYLHFVELILSYIIYMGLVILIWWIIGKIKKK